MTTLNQPKPDVQAISIAEQIHKMADAEQTYLFGSRARGDYRLDSDIDVLVVKQQRQMESWLENLRKYARETQRTQMPNASGIDIICMTVSEFAERRDLINHMANTITKEGYPVMPGERTGYGTDYPSERIDWDDVDQKITAATGAANWIDAIQQAGIIDAGDDLQFGRVAQNALEFAYKAVLGANGCEYPTSGRDGHNLRILTDLLRENQIIGADELAPGENHKYLTEFGGGAVYAPEHSPLDRGYIANDIPQAVAQLREMVDNTRED